MFKFTVAISAFILVSCVDAAPRTRRPHVDGRIVGGVSTNISEVPYQLSLEYAGSHICGAAIIHESFAVTAAHCVYGLSTSLISLRAGSSLREADGSLHQVQDVIVHPYFDFFSIDYDLAVISVTQPFEFGENVMSIPIASSEPAPGSMAVVSGWGANFFGGPLSSQLQKVTVPIVDHDKCNEAYSFFGGITKNMICAAAEEGGKDACLGDTGSPLVVGKELVGVVSWGLSCGAPGFPGVYTNLPALSQEFRNMLHKHPRFSSM